MTDYSDKDIHVPAIYTSPYYKALRRQIAIALIFSPTMCVLPFLAYIARTTRVDGIIWGVWILISLALISVIGRAALLIRRITTDSSHSQTQDH